MKRLKKTLMVFAIYLIISSVTIFAENELSWTLPDGYLFYVQSEINKWDDLGATYKQISRNPFFGDIMVLGAPQIRKGPVTGKTYFNCARPTTFVFPKEHTSGEIRFTLWVHGDDAAGAKAYVKTSDDIVHVVISDAHKIELIETSDTLKKETIWGPGKEISVQVSSDTRYIWVMPSSQRVIISDLSFIEESSHGTSGYIDATKKIKTFINEEFNFSLSIPANWTQEDDPEALLYLKAEDRLSMILIMGQLLTSPRATLNDMISQVEMLTGYDVVESKKIIVDGVEGVVRSYKTNNSGVPIKLKVVYLLKDKLAYGIVCGTWEGLFDQLMHEFDEIIKEFKFLDKHGLRQSSSDNPRFSASGLVLASEFRGKRDYIARARAIFSLGEEVNIYTEFSNFTLLEGVDPKYTASIKIEVHVLSPSRDVIYEESKEYISHPTRVQDVPKYIFINIPYKIPQSAKEGVYEVQLLGKDMVGQEEVILIGRFEVKSL